MTGPATKVEIDRIEVIAPNLKRRLSGVTATIARLVPVQAKQINIVTTGPGLPADVPNISMWRLPFLQKNRRRVWHARRNTEMIAGLFLRQICRHNLALMFTSASQRNHTKLTKLLISKMDAVIATSKKTSAYLDVPATVIMHGIDTSTFAPAKNKPKLRARLRVSKGLLVGCYGRIRHQKGTDVFVDAMIRLCQQFPDLSGIVMGRAVSNHSDFLHGLRSKVADAGLSDRIMFRTEVSVNEIPEWYQILDIFVAPQRWEGFGLTPLEAMACGIPVVAGRVGAFEEQILDGETGTIIQAGDVSELATAIGGMVSDSAKMTLQAAAARQHVLQKFQIEREADALVAVYRGLLAK